MFHSVALTGKGKIFTWGAGPATGLLRDGETSLVETPREVWEWEDNKDLGDLARIAAGPYHTLAMTEKGHLFSWGMGSEGRLGFEPNTESGNAIIPVRVKEQF